MRALRRALPLLRRGRRPAASTAADGGGVFGLEGLAAPTDWAGLARDCVQE